MPILYCRCAYAQVIPDETKDAVLHELCATSTPFTAVADLCEMSARRDPRLAVMAQQSGWKIAACHARAVQWLFHAADAPLPADAEIINLRELAPATAVAQLTASPTP